MELIRNSRDSAAFYWEGLYLSNVKSLKELLLAGNAVNSMING